MKLLLLAALCAGVCFGNTWNNWSQESHERQVEDSSFRSGREYTFFYDGQLSTGIPGSSKQHSAQRLRALVSLVFKGESHVLLKLSNVRVGKLNREISNPRKIMPLQAFEEVRIEPQLQSTLESIVKFSYKNGMIEEIVFDSAENTWSANIKRSILNLLQVNLQQRNRLDAVEDMRWTNTVRETENGNVFYRVMEETIEGECETLYTVRETAEHSTPVLNVTKSINFEKCRKRPQIQYNFRFADHCPSCESKYSDDEKFVKSSTVAKYNITGTKQSFLIESARVESEYIFTPLNEEANVIVTYVNQTLVLMKSGPITSQLHDPRSPIKSDSNMVFTLDWDIAYEKFHMTGREEFHEQLHQSQKGANKVELAKVYLRKTVQQMKERLDEEVPRNFLKLVSIMRMCKENELEQLMQSEQHSSVEESKRVKILLPQALGICGTKTCVKLLSQKIRQGQVPTLRAVMAIKALLQNRIASNEIITELHELVESSTVAQNPHLKRHCWLVIGSLMNALCSQNDDQLALEIKEQADTYCNREQKEKYVQLLFNKFRQETKWEDKIMILKSIANAGLDVSIVKLEQIIRQLDGSYPTYIRFEAISALRLLKDVMQKKIQRVLMPVVMDRREYPSIRAAASYFLLQTLPERPLLDQLTRSLISEPSRQFASFLYTQMESYANSTNPCEKRFATDLKLSLRNAKKVSTGLGYSMLKRLSMHSPKQFAGLDLDVDTLFTNTTAMPRHLSASLHLNVLGFWQKHLASISFFNDGLLETLSRSLMEMNLFNKEQLSSILRRHPRETVNEFERELDELFSTHLHVRHRDFSADYESEPKAYLAAMYKSQSVSFMPISKESILEFIQEESLSLVDLQQKLERGVNIDYGTITMLHDLHYKIPTSMGLPLMMTTKVPLAWNIEGVVKAVKEHSGSVKITTELKPKIVATVYVDLKAWSPIVNSGVKLVSKIQLFTPIDAQLKVDLFTEPKTIKLLIKPPTQKRELLVLESRPMTYTREWQRFIRNEENHQEDRTIAGEELNRVSTVNECHVSRVFGVEYCIRSHLQNTQYYKIKGTPFAPLAGLNKIVITAQPGPEMSQEIEIELNGKITLADQSERPSFSEHSQFSWESSDSRENSQSKESTENSKEYLQSYRRYSLAKGYKAEAQMQIRSGSSRRFTADLTAVVDAKKRYSKMNIKMQNQPSSWQACFDSEMMYPETPEKVEDVKQKKIAANAKLSWGSQCNSDKYIRVSTEVERSNQQIQWEREQTEYETFRSENCKNKAWCSPLTQEDVVEKIAQMNKYRVEVDYSNVPDYVKNVTNKFYRALKYYYFFQTDVNQMNVQNPQDKIRAEIILDAYTKQRVNVTIKTPKETVRMQDLPLSQPISFALNQKKSFTQQFADFVEDDREQAECSIVGRNGYSSRSEVETFDGVKYSAPFKTDCWVTLAKDCGSNKPKFAVMARKSASLTEGKEVKIITRNVRIELRPTEEKVQIFVNGQPFEPETHESTVDADIERVGSTVRINLPVGVKVTFDGYAINVKLSELFRAQQCGLCGHYDLETADEFRNPDFTVATDLRQFYMNYVVKESTCTRPNEQEVCEDESCGRFFRSEERSRELSSSSSSSEEIDQDNDSTTERPKLKTKVIEMDNRICFSTEMIPQCDDDSFPIKSAQEKRVPYVCLNENDSAAEEYERQARYGSHEITALRTLNPAFTRTESIPEKCKEYTRN